MAELAASKAGEGVEELADEPGFEDIAAEGPLEAAGGLAPVISSLVLLQVLGDAAWADEDDTTS